MSRLVIDSHAIDYRSRLECSTAVAKTNKSAMTRQSRNNTEWETVMSEDQQETGKGSLRDQIYRRALEDPDFREEFLADPAGALATMTGQPLPEELVVVAVEDTATQINIPIPSADIAAGALQGVAGGRYTDGNGTIHWDISEHPPMGYGGIY